MSTNYISISNYLYLTTSPISTKLKKKRKKRPHLAGHAMRWPSWSGGGARGRVEGQRGCGAGQRRRGRRAGAEGGDGVRGRRGELGTRMGTARGGSRGERRGGRRGGEGRGRRRSRGGERTVRGGGRRRRRRRGSAWGSGRARGR